MDAAHLPAPVHTLTDRLLALDFPFVDVDYPTFFFFVSRTISSCARVSGQNAFVLIYLPVRSG